MLSFRLLLCKFTINNAWLQVLRKNFCNISTNYLHPCDMMYQGRVAKEISDKFGRWPMENGIFHLENRQKLCYKTFLRKHEEQQSCLYYLNVIKNDYNCAVKSKYWLFSLVSEAILMPLIESIIQLVDRFLMNGKAGVLVKVLSPVSCQ